MSREFHSHQPANAYSPGEQNNSNETVSENDDSDSVRSIRSDNSDQDQEEGEFQIHSSANEHDDGNDSSVTEIGSAERELKEQGEKEKRQSLLQEVQVHVLSSEVSSSEDDGAGQLSNLRAIALIENETRRYVSNLTIIASKPNNISLSRQEKAKAKKRVKRYPSYGHIKGEYTIAPNTNTYHITRIGKSNNYYYSNLESQQYN